MAVDGKEIASLDFANLIGGPLNAIVEAQAKAAITTVNFIRDVAFNEDKKVVNVDFKYNRRNDEDQDEEFTLTVPFLTMLPVPYITVTNALVEFNAKITSMTTHESNDDFKTEATANANAGYWFASAKLESKTSYQRKSSTSDKEERTFDMHVKVEAKNQDMPAGTERLLTILENSIAEKKSSTPGNSKIKAKIKSFAGNNITINCTDGAKIRINATFSDDQAYTVSANPTNNGGDEWVLTVTCSGTPAPTNGNDIVISNP